MQKLASTKQARGRARVRRISGLRRWHRWAGLAAMVFIAVLSSTGIALNHAGDWSLDERHVSADWLLDLYGIRAPKISASFAVDDDYVTLAENRLYVNGIEAAAHVESLAGAVRSDDHIAAATQEAVLLLSRNGELVDRIELAHVLNTPIMAIGTDGNTVLIAIRGQTLALDERNATLRATTHSNEPRRWSAPSPLPSELVQALDHQHRGAGVSWERILLDLHSGRLARRGGVLLADFAGVLLLALAATGFALWLTPLFGRRHKG
jgi:hypothetical protein